MNTTASADIVEKGKEWYYRLKPELLKKYDEGDYVSFDVDSGDYFVEKNSIESLQKAKEKYPNKQFFFSHKSAILPGTFCYNFNYLRFLIFTPVPERRARKSVDEWFRIRRSVRGFALRNPVYCYAPTVRSWESFTLYSS